MRQGHQGLLKGWGGSQGALKESWALGQVVNYSDSRTAEEICESSSKMITFIDLAGHHKYLHTTIFGLTSYCPDCALLLVSANTGIGTRHWAGAGLKGGADCSTLGCLKAGSHTNSPLLPFLPSTFSSLLLPASFPRQLVPQGNIWGWP